MPAHTISVNTILTRLRSVVEYAVILAPTYELVNSTTWLNGGSPPNGALVQRCNIAFNIPMPLHAPVYLYYRLTNFYQNHRKYVKSLSYNQLKGQVITPADASTSCTQMSTDANGTIYYPCGLIANSVFNGTYCYHISFFFFGFIDMANMRLPQIAIFRYLFP